MINKTFMILGIFSTLFSNTKTTSYNNSINNEFSLKSKTNEISEENLEIETYQPNDEEMSKFIQFNKTKNKDDRFSIEVKVNNEEFLNLLREGFYNSGLNTGTTLFEKLEKSGDLAIDYTSVISQIKIGVISNDNEREKHKSLSSLIAGGGDLISSENPSMIITPTEKAKELYVHLGEVYLDGLSFADKKKLVKNPYGYLANKDTQKPYYLEELVIENLDENRDNIDESIWKAYNQFVVKLTKEFKNKIPYSNNWSVIKANQNSEKENYLEGYNLKIANEISKKDIGINPPILLFPLVGFSIVVLYAWIRKIFRNKNMKG